MENVLRLYLFHKISPILNRRVLQRLTQSSAEFLHSILCVADRMEQDKSKINQTSTLIYSPKLSIKINLCETLRTPLR